ncbi:hypothetical protein [Shewanella surugensis]|uniref:Uncharacterized protein n=1 Tax=Shewanella surugensis TaxID=212020 RepID=A0ABT0LK83_9GAMM|nr:hypothetical protein [Shewanella surugensis]MCL1127551.1 hypothetical protein [Shewanella surugensis]
MNTALLKELSEDHLSKDSLSVSAPHSITLEPKRSAVLYGRAGASYQLILINEDEDLDANVYVSNQSDGYIVSNLNLEPTVLKKKLFQMNPQGYVTVWNYTSSKFTPNPMVSFAIKALK